MTLEELKALYGEKGATVRREYETEGGTQYVDEPIDLGGGIYATENTPIIGYEGYGENQQPIYGEKQFTGFSKNEDGKNYYYNPEGQLYHVEKESSFWDDFGPMIMTAATMGGGAGMLGNSLFGLTGNAASAAGGALLGGANAAFTDQDILKGALLGGAASAGGMELGDTGLKVADAAKAYNFAQNPTLAGAASLASPYVSGTQIGDTGMSIGDVFKGVGTAQALSSGDDQQIFRALTGLAKDQGGSLKSSLAGFEANPEDFIEGYFQPGGEGYLDLGGQDMTVREEPENLDALLRELSPYAVDGGTSVFAQGEDIPEFETVDKRPVASLADLFGDTDIMQTFEADVPEMTITDSRPVSESNSLRTKDIVSDIPDEVITADQIDKLFPNFDFNQILQTVTSPGAKVATPAKPAAPGTKTTQQALADLGLNMQQAPSQDPYADIKLMQELFGQDIAYKLLSLGGDKRK
jgi:hypothetical protein